MCFGLDRTDLSRASYCWLLSMLVLAQILGLSIVLLITIWLNDYLKGFGWDGTGKEFNVHPLCMTLALIYFFGTSTVVYRAFRNVDKFYVKIIHATLNGMAIICVIIGLVAVFQFHDVNHIKNLYSLHSWCGILTVALFFLQYVAGFLAFLFPKFKESTRSSILPLHRNLGMGLLLFVGVTIVSGINEKLIFSLKGKLYQNLPTPAILGNVAGLLVVFYVLVLYYILQKPEWKRSLVDQDYENLS